MCKKNDYLLISTHYSFVCSCKSSIRSRSHIKFQVIPQGQGQIEAVSKDRCSNTRGFHLN